MKALLLAAGKSTRIAPISGGIPKPLISFQGKSIIERNIAWLVSQGIDDLWINLHYRPESIMEHLGDGSSLGAKIHYSLEREILGTAGAVRHLREMLDSTCLIIYGDNLYDFSLEPFFQFHRESKASISIALFDQTTHLHTGIAGGKVLLEGDEIRQFVEGNSCASFYVNTGVYLLEKEMINEIPDNSFFDFGNDLFPKCINNGIKICGYIIDGYCLGIDTPESYHKALDMFS
ncbi:MAG: nucleotidyltransferase family protein [Chlamydiales bacterium]|nr:nucleotidyltransferase family protein [Chlamydiales bacterium]